MLFLSFMATQLKQLLEKEKRKQKNYFQKIQKNIARGTTDPGIASLTWIIFPATKLANSVAWKIQVKYFRIDFSGT